MTTVYQTTTYGSGGMVSGGGSMVNIAAGGVSGVAGVVKGGVINSGALVPLAGNSRKVNIQAANGGSVAMATSALSFGSGAGSSGDATLDGWLREKEELKGLNMELAEKVTKLRYYMAKYEEQDRLIRLFEQTFHTFEARLRAKYEAELARLNADIEATVADTAETRAKLDRLNWLEFQKKWEHILDQQEQLDATLTALEEEKFQKEMRIDFLANTLKGLVPQVSGFKAEISNYKKQMFSSQAGVDAEIAGMAELGGQLGAKDEEIKHLIKLYNAKLNQRLDKNFNAVENTYEREFTDALDSMNEEYKAQVEALTGTGSNDAWYMAQFSADLKIQERNAELLKLAEAEFMRLQKKLTVVSGRLQQIQAEKTSIEAEIDTLKGQLASFINMYDVQKKEKMELIYRLEQDYKDLNASWQILTDRNLALTAEIDRYRVILGGISTTTVSGGAIVGGGGYSVGGGSYSVGGGSTIVGGGSSIVGGGSTIVGGGSSIVGGGSTIISGGSSIVGGQTVIGGGQTVIGGGSTMYSSGGSITSGSYSVSQ